MTVTRDRHFGCNVSGGPTSATSAAGRRLTAVAHYAGASVATQKSKRRSRKRRNESAIPRSVPSQRREQRSTREAVATPPSQRPRRNPVGTYGERPQSPFAGLPISELASFAGGVGLIVGLVRGGGPALIVGIVICTLGVVEITAREHFSGYRSHTILLAALPAVATEVAFVAIVGEPNPRLLLLAVIVPVYAVLFWLLRDRFAKARQARVARPPAA
jgi:hypothetical protein